MPELPEVQTTVNGLNHTVRGKKIIDAWTDLAVKTPSLPHHQTTTKSRSFFNSFKKMIVGTTIKRASRRGKNILIDLSNGQSIWVHMKMTGHMMYGQYIFDTKTKTWKPDPSEKNKALFDPYNKFLHTVFSLANGKQLVLSDMRKFAKVSILPTATTAQAFSNLGPEPLNPAFTASVCSERLHRRPNMAIKLALLDQTLIAGIGNIYSDEALWIAGIHPFRKVDDISKQEMKKLYLGIEKSLRTGIDFGGDSTSDYRDINGERGKFQGRHEAYRRTGKPCRKRGCTGIIARLPFGGRNAHFCPVHQK